MYDDAARAEAYSRLEFPGTYYLAYRDLPQILARHVAGRRAVDFGCGAGRSTRFLRRLGFASFSTRDDPANREARSGDVVRIVMTDVTDRRPVEDAVCSKASYLDIYREAGLAVVASHEPLGRNDEPFEWVSETRVAPWRLDVLERA